MKLAGDNWDECTGAGHEFLNRKPSERALVIFGGPALNYILAFLCFYLVNIIGYPNNTARVGEIMVDYPAAASGLVKGDRITSIDAKKIAYWPQIQETIRNKKSSVIELGISRDGQKLKLLVKLKKKVVKNILGVSREVNVIGIRSYGEIVLVRHNLFEGFMLAGKQLWDLTILTIMALLQMLTGGISFKESVTGPLGMYYITSEAVKVGGINAIFHLMAVLSASLGIFNLLPLPVLDGGHLFFLGLERLRGKHLSRKVEEKISQIGFAFIISLGIFVFLNDLVTFGVWQKLRVLFVK